MQFIFLKQAKYLITLLGVGFFLCSSHAENYPAPEYSGPPSNPAFPPAFAAFSPPVTNLTPLADAPTIAELTRQNQPGDTMVLTGDKLSSFSGDAEGRDTRFVVFGQSNSGDVLKDASIQNLDGMQAALKLSTDLPSDQMYMMWPRNDNGFGAPVKINQTEAWWVGPDKVERNKSFSVYGRNLSLGGGNTYLYVEELDMWLTSGSQNPFKADFLATNIPLGTYTVWVHNGKGREYGWADSLSLTVVDAIDWEGGSVFLASAYGAHPDDGAPDTTAIKNALNAAAAAGGYNTVVLESGQYDLNYQLYFPNNVRLKGNGMSDTVLRCTGATTYLMTLGDYNVVQDMTVESGPYTITRVMDCVGESHITLKNLIVTQNEDPNTSMESVGADQNKTAISLNDSSYITLTNCHTISRSLIWVGSSRQVFFQDCTFKGQYHPNSLIKIERGEVSIIGCTASHYDTDLIFKGWTRGRFVDMNGGRLGAIKNVYYGNNTTVNMGPSMHPSVTSQIGSNHGEQINIENGNSIYQGNISAATANTVTLPYSASLNPGDLIMILDGKGIGQYRIISGVSGAQLTVSKDWRVIPEASSYVSAGDFVTQIAVWDSDFEGMQAGVDDTTENNGSSGTHFYSGICNMVVQSNTYTRLKSGTEMWSQHPTASTPNVMPCLFNIVADNAYSNNRFGIEVNFGTWGWTGATPDVKTHFGNVVRGNSISSPVESGISYLSGVNKSMFGLNVFDHNIISDAPVALEYDGDATRTWSWIVPTAPKNQLYIGNLFTNVTVNVHMSSGSVAYFNNHTTDGVDTGNLPGGILNLPNRVAAFDGSNLQTDVFVDNCGTDTINWNASTTSDWLNLTQASGTIADGDSSDSLNFTMDDAVAVPAEGTEAVVTVASDSGQTRQLTVIYSSDISSPPPPDGPPAPVLSSIAVSGPTSVEEQTTAQYTCTATYSDGTTQTVSADWSENSSYATINSSGVLNAGSVTADQSVTISASFGGQTDTHAVTIQYVAPVLTGLTVAGATSVDEGTTAQYTCTATYSDGTSATVVPTWSENASYTTINSSGQLTAGNVTSDQSVTVTASFGGQTDTHTVTIKYVAPVLTGIAISGATSVDEGTTAQYTCTAIYSDGTSSAVSPTWSENASYTTINSSGLLAASNVTSDQSVTVTASFSGQTDTHTVTIQYIAPVLTGLTISGATSLDEETSAPYSCTATYSDGTSATVVPTWSENSSYATISAGGVLSAGDVTADRSLTINASYGGESAAYGVTILYVEPPVVVTGISITGPVEMDENSTANFSCTASYSDGTTASVSPAWSEDAAFASINSSGALSVGNIDADSTLTVTASYQGVTANQVMSIWTVGTRIVYPLTGFSGKQVRARLWDDVAGELIPLGELNSPDELVITDVNSNQWYWVVVEEYDEPADNWVRVHENWISM